MQIIKQTNLFWHISLVLKIGTLRLFKRVNYDTSLPTMHGGFRLQKAIKDFPCGIGIYEDSDGRRVLIKIWRGSVKTYAYYQFLKEINLYELLHGVLNRIGSDLDQKYRNVHIPRILEKEISPTYIMAVFEYVEDCIHLRDVASPTEKEGIFNLATEFWRYIGSKLNAGEKSQLPRRTLAGTLFAYGVGFVYAIIRYPQEIRNLIRTVPIVMRAIPSLASNWREGLVHRDFHFENVLVSNNRIIIIDFGDNALTNYLNISVNSLHWEWDDHESRKIILKNILSLCGKSQETAKTFRALFAISAVQLLHDAENKKRLKFNFRCFNAVVNQWDEISYFLSGNISQSNSARLNPVIKERLLSLLRKIRAPLVRIIKPVSKYVLLTRSPSLEPLSTKYGFDRGTPIDRYYIEKFLTENKNLIKGNCLEIQNNNYTLRFGEDKVTKSDVLDMHNSNKQATIYGNLQSVQSIPDNTFDTIILTQTLGMVPDFDSAVKECHRILKPSGNILFTSKAMGPVYDIEGGYWKFTVPGITYLFGKYFSKDRLKVSSHGNVLSGQAFWVGMAMEELTKEQLDHNDPRYAIIVTAVATK